ncbi:ATPase [Zymomonas sp.]|uniref:F0F1 ATP synthase subunit B family protein n=1 Tax=Zymomonas sp. TaxID=2068624 RepID=UPI0025F19FF6|nr:ATPase [Zymomonas sp.]MCA1955179.1 ATPase [Zymomonas sp.]
MPQIAQLASTYASQVFWMLVVFGIIYFGIAKTMLVKVESTMDSRDSKISDDLAAAEAAHKAAKEADEACQSRLAKVRSEAQSRLQAAKEQASKDASQQNAAANADYDHRIDSARMRIADEKSKVMADLENIASDIAHDIVKQITGRSVSKEQITKAVAQVISADMV